MTCFNAFANKSNLNRHTKTFHRPLVDEFVDTRQSGGKYGGNGVQSTSQTKLENAVGQVDVTSQTDFEDDNQSAIVNVGFTPNSDNHYRDSELSEKSNGDKAYLIYNF